MQNLAYTPNYTMIRETRLFQINYNFMGFYSLTHKPSGREKAYNHPQNVAKIEALLDAPRCNDRLDADLVDFFKP